MLLKGLFPTATVYDGDTRLQDDKALAIYPIQGWKIPTNLIKPNSERRFCQHSKHVLFPVKGYFQHSFDPLLMREGQNFRPTNREIHGRS